MSISVDMSDVYGLPISINNEVTVDLGLIGSCLEAEEDFRGDLWIGGVRAHPEIFGGSFTSDDFESEHHSNQLPGVRSVILISMTVP